MLAAQATQENRTHRARARGPQNEVEVRHYELIRTHSSRYPQRNCFPLDGENYLFVRQYLAERGMKYGRVPVESRNEVWYFYSKVEDFHLIDAAIKASPAVVENTMPLEPPAAS